MKHSFKQKVFYSDTDAYGVVWHGAYLRWLEMGRILLCDQLGYDMNTLKENNIVFPVTNINIDYKSPAKLNENLIITTSITKITPLYFVFSQTICDEITGAVRINADIKVVTVDNQGKLYRRIPQEIFESLNKILEKK